MKRPKIVMKLLKLTNISKYMDQKDVSKHELLFTDAGDMYQLK